MFFDGGFKDDGDAVFVVGRGLLPAAGFGQGAQFGGGVAHHDGLACPLQHIDIVPVVADGHGLGAG